MSHYSASSFSSMPQPDPIKRESEDDSEASDECLKPLTGEKPVLSTASDPPQDLQPVLSTSTDTLHDLQSRC